MSVIRTLKARLSADAALAAPAPVVPLPVAKPAPKAKAVRHNASRGALADGEAAEARAAKPAPKAAKPAPKAKAGRIGLPRFADTAKITVLAKGKVNPRKAGTGPHKRYAVLLKSKTVADFLKALPEWRATINRAEKEGYIRVG